MCKSEVPLEDLKSGESDGSYPINIYPVSSTYKQNVTLKGYGHDDEDIDITKEGKDIMIGFNPRFLIDALRVIDDETIDIYLMNPKAPCFIRDEQQSYIYLILPVNFMA